MGRRTRKASVAFTLLELVLVLVVLSTALAVAAPSMRGWSKGSTLRDAGDQFLAVARWARSQAVAGAKKVAAQFKAFGWRGDPQTLIDLRWA